MTGVQLRCGCKFLKIVLDGGHGIMTSGKRTPDNSMREYEFNSRVAELVKNELQYYENVEIKFTHDNDRDVPLDERCRVANNWNAVSLFPFMPTHMG